MPFLVVRPLYLTTFGRITPTTDFTEFWPHR
jgi:hypothetical protein